MNIQEAINVSKRAVRRGGVEMFRVKDAIAIVEECRRRGQPILGIDAFILTKDATQPVLEHSLDLSTDRDPAKNSHDRALAHLKKLSKDEFWFEIVY